MFYPAHGARMVWLVYPAAKRLVEVLTTAERHLLTATDTLTGADELPGLQITISELFPED